MDLIILTTLAGGRIAVFAQDVARVTEVVQELCDVVLPKVTSITFRDRDTVVVREPFEQVMDTLNKVWQGVNQ